MFLPIADGDVGVGDRAHASNEYYVIEGAGKTYGMAGAEKSVAALIYNYATMPSTAPAAPNVKDFVK